MAGLRGGKSYANDDTDRGRLWKAKRKLECARMASAKGKFKNTRITEMLVSTPPDLKRKREEIEEEKMSKKSKCANVNLTRSSGIKPRCSNYGCYRHAFYQRHGFFFCNACVLYDSVVEKRAVNSESRRYKCTAGHTSLIFPTTRIKNSTYRSSQQIYNCQRIWKAPVEEGNESETESLLTSEEEQEAESSDEEEE
eukprot:scaffold314359_cov49-Attheya_sp.AAC.1